MKKLMNYAAAVSAVVVASAGPLLAQTEVGHWWWWNPRPTPVTSVPEIDASSGMLAVAAVLAILAFVVERRRRAA